MHIFVEPQLPTICIVSLAIIHYVHKSPNEKISVCIMESSSKGVFALLFVILQRVPKIDRPYFCSQNKSIVCEH